MKANHKVCAAVIAVSMFSAGSALAAEKWMTGDWHQHTVYTDGSNIMADLEIDKSVTPPIFTILTGKYTNASPNFAPLREGAAGKNEYKGVIPQGFRYGLDFQANSEHGGNRGARDGFGRYWDDAVFYASGVANIPLLGGNATYSNTCDYNNIDSPSCLAPAHKVMWRWQELADFNADPLTNPLNYMSAFNWIETLRGQFPAKEIMTGMEWNVPGHEHASTGNILNSGKAIAEFEYRFDNTDTDATGPALVTGLDWAGKILSSAYTVANGYPDYSAVLGLNAAHNKSIAGLKWLNDYYPTTSWVNPAHVERAGCGVGGYSIAAFRDMNDTAPTVFFGFEGMPGHQKASNRGEISATSCGAGTFGGAGTYIATVGGLWDNLLADGRKIFNFVSSDFHMTQDDFYPGEYAKTYVRAKDNTLKSGAYTQQDVVDAMRSGNSYAVHGDLINDLDYKVIFKTPFGSKSATMGEALTVRKGNKVTVQIRFKSPTTANNNGDIPSVHHVQLIQGRVNPVKAAKLVDGAANPAFNAVDSTVAGIVATYDANSWTTDAQGYTTMSFTVPVQNDAFFRIRGTNKGYDEAGQTDAAGSPLKDVPGSNNAAEAWKDLWFYSNPIFVKAL